MSNTAVVKPIKQRLTMATLRHENVIVIDINNLNHKNQPEQLQIGQSQQNTSRV